MTTKLKVIIAGAGLGGLACAIACRQQGLDVTILERAPELLPIGAGIQVPPNAARVMSGLGLLSSLLETACSVDAIEMRRYEDGRQITWMPGGKTFVEKYGAPWLVIHRADYHQVLLDETVKLGVEIRLNADVVEVDFENSKIRLRSGEIVSGDVIVGADGLWSTIRTQLLGYPSPPVETGDLAYRGTFSLEQLRSLDDSRVEELCARSTVTLWLGPDRHCVFYPVKGGSQFNLVLLRPDDLPENVRIQQADIDEMRSTFDGWDPILTKLITCLSSVLKWKLCHHDELKTWTKGHVALLGDSCHPTLPYQAQGAAMAVEDGAVLGNLLGLLSSHLSSTHRDSEAETTTQIPLLLQLYESLRKSRTTLNVRGAVANRTMYHLHDGQRQRERDDALAKADFDSQSEWNWANAEYLRNLLSVDVVGESTQAFERWWSKRKVEEPSESRL